MIDRVVRASWRARQLASRSELTARLLRIPLTPAAERGLLLVQIDGLSKRTLEDAVASGTAPSIAELITNGGYRPWAMYAGVPSSTPVAQAELFYGASMVVPAWAFVDRASGMPVRMSQPDTAAAVEHRLSAERPLLAGGSSYCNLFGGGALEARFCISSLAWTDPVRTHHPLAILAALVLLGSEIARSFAAIARELIRAPLRLVHGVTAGQDVRSELKLAASHAAVGVVLREVTALSTMIDVARGMPIVYLNLLGYDEVAHRRGPSSRTAQQALSGIDAVVGRLAIAARESRRRSYEMWVLSDHGQEPTVSYIETRGTSIEDAVADVFRSCGIPFDVSRRRRRDLGRTGRRLFVHARDDRPIHWAPGRLVVTAQGPLGHVYSPRPLTADERDALARALVDDAGVPMVLCADGAGATVWNGRGEWCLPADASEVLGRTHPYKRAAAQDLVALCHHRDAGDLVLCGWSPGTPAVSFPHENGSHGGPGPAETDAFVLTPWDVPLGVGRDRDSPLRPRHVRRAAFALLDGDGDGDGDASAPRPAAPAQQPAAEGTVRLLTYNVHSCVGLDGAVSVDRIAQVIASHDPDIVALQEVDVRRSRTGGVDQAQAIADRLEMLLHFHPALSLGEELYGDAVLSRFPMRVVRAGPLPRWRRLEPRGAIHVAVDVAGSTLHLINTHLGLDPVEGALQASALCGREWLGSIPQGRALLCGDLNAMTWFPAHRRLTRRLKNAGSAVSGVRVGRTFHGAFLPGAIDHVLVDPAITISHVAVGDDGLARVASDHLPLVVDLRVEDAHS